MKSIAISILLLLIIALPSCAIEVRSNIYNINNGILECTPKDFAGFFYDPNEDIGRERLRINISENQIGPGYAEYITSMQNDTFEYSNWGTYKVLCFLGEKYFAGYNEDCKIASPWNSLRENHLLGKILIDSNEKRTLGSNESLPLEEGYSVKFSDAENGVKASLYKDNLLAGSTVLAQLPADYVYNATIGGHNSTLIAVHLKGNVRLTPTSYYTTTGLFQLSRNITPINTSSTYGIMAIKSIEDSGLVLTNTHRLNITGNSDKEIINGIRLKVTAPAGNIYLYKNSTQSGVQEVRGSVKDFGTISSTWDASTFAGFYHDSDSDIGSEIITITLSDVDDEKSTAILSDQQDFWGISGVVYSTYARPMNFKFKPWSNFYSIGFLGQGYFAGYAEGDGSENGTLWQRSPNPRSLVDGYLTKVLLDDNELKTIKTGDSLVLKDGYEARLYVDDSCNKTLIELYKNGNLTDRDYFKVPHTYTYAKNLGSSGDMVVLALHISGVNCTAKKTYSVDGIFQISDTPIQIAIGQKYGKASVKVIDPTTMTIKLDNSDEQIMLFKDMDIPLIGNIRIKTADQREINDKNPLRYYIYKKG